MNQKLKIGVLGAGHLGKIHLRLIQESSAYELVGFYDSQPQIAAKISRELPTINSFLSMMFNNSLPFGDISWGSPRMY